MSQYKFVTQWSIEAPLDRVWDTIRDMDRWPEWWKYVKKVSVVQTGNADDIGSIRRITWATALPYSLTFDSELVSIEHHRRIEGKAFGELTGVGIWTFDHKDNHTFVQYDWQVTTSKKWMNILAPFARPLFSWNHDKVMHAGYEGLRKRLEL